MQDRMLSPGDPVAYSEEYLPGPGIYDDGEQLRAAVFGKAEVDPKTMQVRVEPAGKAGGVPRIEKGDILIGEITFIKPELASVKVVAVRGKEHRPPFQDIDATLHVSKADQRYVDDLQKLYSTGDLIRARVIGMRGGPQLTTDKPDLGVVRARSREGRIMERKGGALQDPESGRTEGRKTAEDYGSGQV